MSKQPTSEQIDQFFNPDGTLISIPVKSAKKIAVLLHIARDLSPTTKYPEKELNAIIAKYHDDTAAIRRHMIEYGILERDSESAYWIRQVWNLWWGNQRSLITSSDLFDQCVWLF